jgi:hypothetical protein
MTEAIISINAEELIIRSVQATIEYLARGDWEREAQLYEIAAKTFRMRAEMARYLAATEATRKEDEPKAP